MSPTRRTARAAGLLLGICALLALVLLALARSGGADDGERALRAAIDGCLQLTEAQATTQCLAGAYGRALGNASPAERIPQLEQVIDTSPAREGCHDVMHQVGRQYGSRRQITLADLQDSLPRSRSPLCAAGFAHGLLTWLGPEVNHADPARVRAACYRSGTRAQRLGCIHGLGHAYLRSAPDLDYALARCARLGMRDDLDCAQGVFHDYWMAAFGADGAPQRLVREREPYRLCLAVAARFREGCWFRAARILPLDRPLAAVEDLKAACRGSRAARRRGCLLMLGGRTRPTEDAARGRVLQLAICGQLEDPPDALACAKGINIFEDIARVGPARAVALVNQCATLPPGARTPCAAHFGRSLAALAAWDVAAACRRTRPLVRAACQDGARSTDGVIGNLG